MRASSALAAWLADDAVQARTAAAGRRFAAWVRRRSPLALTAATLDGIDATDATAIEAALRPLLDDTTWLERLIDEALGWTDDPFFEPPFATMGGRVPGLVLLDHPLALVTAAILPAAGLRDGTAPQEARSIGFPGAVSLTRFVRGGALIEWFEADAPGPDFTAAAARPCRRAGRTVTNEGALIRLDGRTRSFAVARATRDIVLLRAELRVPASEISREYDAGTLALLQLSAAEEGASRTVMMLSLLRLLGRRDAVPVFVEAVRDGPFHQRWAAMRELLALDAAAALPLLRPMAVDDPHPEVRALAARMLARLRPPPLATAA